MKSKKTGQPRQVENINFIKSDLPLFLRHCSVDGYGGEVLLDQKLSQGHASLDRLHKDDHLQTTSKVLKPGNDNIRKLAHETSVVELVTWRI